jgi:hypothetical protein
MCSWCSDPASSCSGTRDSMAHSFVHLFRCILKWRENGRLLNLIRLFMGLKSFFFLRFVLWECFRDAEGFFASLNWGLSTSI